MTLEYNFSTSKEKLCQHAQSVAVQRWVKAKQSPLNVTTVANGIGLLGSSASRLLFRNYCTWWI